jgi:hypothetical protein
MAQDNKVQVSDVQKDHILMKEVKCYLLSTQTIIMDQDIVMTNGTIVSIGEVTLRDGITMMK